MKRFWWFSKSNTKISSTIKNPLWNSKVKELYTQMHDQFLHDKHRDALTTSRKILDIAPEHTATLLLVAKLHTRKKHYDKAAEYYTKILKNNESNVDARFGRAECMYFLFRYEEALEDYLELYEKSLSNTSYILWVANTYQKLNLMNIASRYYNKAIQDAPDDIDTHLWLWYHYMILGRYREADEQAKIAKDLYYQQEHEAPRTDLSNIQDLEKQVKQLVKE